MPKNFIRSGALLVMRDECPVYTGPLGPATRLIAKEAVIVLDMVETTAGEVLYRISLHSPIDGAVGDHTINECGLGETVELAQRYAYGERFGPLGEGYDEDALRRSLEEA